MARSAFDVQTIDRDATGTDGGRILLMAVGAVLVLVGAALLLGVGLLVLQVITDPASVQIVSLFLERTPAAASALSGSVAGSQFSLAIDEPLRTLLFLLVGVWIVGVLASILRVLVLTGKELLLVGRRPRAGS